MPVNPFKHSWYVSRRANGQSGALGVGVVVERSPENHMVAVREVTATADRDTRSAPMPAAVSVAVRGDVGIPEVGTEVILAYFRNSTPIVLGTYYTEQQDIPNAEGTERYIGADDSDGTFIRGPFGVVPTRADDPANPPDGSVWYRTDNDEYRGVEGGSTVTFNTTVV